MPRNEENNNNSSDFTHDVQKIYLEWFLADHDMFALCRNIIKVDYFDDILRPAVRFIVDYADQYSKLPLLEQIKAKTNIDLHKLPDEMKEHSGWLIKDIEKFCRTKALEKAVFSGIDLIKQNRGGELEKLVRDAMSISLITDLGSNYFKDDVFNRLEKMRDKSGLFTTGWKSFDEKLYGGFSRQSLNIFGGGSGSGKSLVLQNLALNWAFLGLNVVYFTLELPEDFVAFRFDAMITGKTTREVMQDIPETTTIIKNKGTGTGSLIIKKFPESGTTVNDLKAFLKEYEIKTGERFDAIIVDYLDLLFPTNGKVDINSLFVKDKFTSEELRALMFEYDAYGVTASQLGRQSIQTQEFDQSHMAGGISKVNTADNVIGIYAPDSLKNNGEIELQFLKCRTSGAVGQRIRLAYDAFCMRISDKNDILESKPIAQLREESKYSKIELSQKPTTLDDPSESKSAVADLMARLKKSD